MDELNSPFFTSSLADLRDTVLDLSSSATPCRYRLMDCGAFRHKTQLALFEYTDFPTVPYTAISYTWRGNEINTTDPSNPNYWKDDLGSFQVKGSEDGDPISLDVLLHACTLSLQKSIRFLWLDRLCIMQTSKPDKIWQIRRMYDIYKSCALCCILPGGIRRLVRVEEETSWIHRGWTLQEALVPKTSIVIFAWSLVMTGKKVAATGRFSPVDVIPGKSAQVDLHRILQASMMHRRLMVDGVQIPVTINIFGVPKAPYAALMDALDAASEEKHREDHQYQCIWRSALLRTSSRPVDMVFSIMRLFNVTLDPSQYDQNDRLGATIALAREIISSGGSASWIGAAYQLDPCLELSTFPRFPETSVAGKAQFLMDDGSRKDVIEVVTQRLSTRVYLIDTPQARTMDKHGFLTIEAHAVRLSPSAGSEPVTTDGKPQPNPFMDPVTNSAMVRAEDNSNWVLDPKPFSPPDPNTSTNLLIFIGDEMQSSSGVFAPFVNPSSVKAWIISKLPSGHYHRITHVNLLKTYKAKFQSFPKLEVSIGGPNVP